MTDLRKEFHYYLDHQDELVNKYNGKLVVIKDCTIIGIYKSYLEAVTKTSKDHP